MPDQPVYHPPEPLLVTVAAVRDVLDTLPADWHLSIEDPTLLVFDERGQPRGAFALADGHFRRVELDEVEPPD